MNRVELVLVSLIVVLLVYLAGLSVEFGVSESSVYRFNHSFEGRVESVEMSFLPVTGFSESDLVNGSYPGYHVEGVMFDHRVEIGADEKSFLDLVGICQHELRHAEFRMMDAGLSYWEEERRIGFGLDRPFRYMAEVQLLNFRPRCYSLAADVVTG